MLGTTPAEHCSSRQLVTLLQSPITPWTLLWVSRFDSCRRAQRYSSPSARHRSENAVPDGLPALVESKLSRSLIGVTLRKRRSGEFQAIAFFNYDVLTLSPIAVIELEGLVGTFVRVSAHIVVGDLHI